MYVENSGCAVTCDGTVLMPQRSMILGLDIGGANLKAALPSGEARTVPFALWKAPQELPQRLRELLAAFPHEALAVTMTAELCDCFATKREGVDAILDSVSAAAPDSPVHVWSTLGRFLNVSEAKADPWRVASANWHALATFAGRYAPQGSALLIDVGSTTTDIIPLHDGKPMPRGRTDPERLETGELVYTGVRRTPVGAILGMEAAAELFATTLDVYLLLDMLPEDPGDCDTADGRPATRPHAHARLARVRCSDVEAFSGAMARELARQVHQRQIDYLLAQSRRVAGCLPSPPGTAIVAGSGAFLARMMAERLVPEAKLVPLRERLSPGISVAACAFAVAHLASER
jgi:probable H4MPT-linked C1 transfer pathway protein